LPLKEKGKKGRKGDPWSRRGKARAENWVLEGGGQKPLKKEGQGLALYKGRKRFQGIIPWPLEEKGGPRINFTHSKKKFNSEKKRHTP